MESARLSEPVRVWTFLPQFRKYKLFTFSSVLRCPRFWHCWFWQCWCLSILMFVNAVVWQGYSFYSADDNADVWHFWCWCLTPPKADVCQGWCLTRLMVDRAEFDNAGVCQCWCWAMLMFAKTEVWHFTMLVFIKPDEIWNPYQRAMHELPFWATSLANGCQRSSVKIYANNDVGWLFYEVEVCVWFDEAKLDHWCWCLTPLNAGVEAGCVRTEVWQCWCLTTLMLEKADVWQR